jgi:hypothetical protein
MVRFDDGRRLDCVWNAVSDTLTMGDSSIVIGPIMIG